MTFVRFQKTNLILFVIFSSTCLLFFQNFTALDEDATIPQFSRADRMARFYQLLEKRKLEIALQDHSNPAVVIPQVGYQKAHYLSPKNVFGPMDFAEERYESYLKRIYDQSMEENIVVFDQNRSTPSWENSSPPLGFTAPEQHPQFVSFDEDCSAALQAALNVGNVWFTPGRTYTLMRQVSIKAKQRKLMSDGTAVVHIKAGVGTQWPVLDRDSTTKLDKIENNQSNVLSAFLIENTSDVQLRDFRMRLAAEPNEPQPLLFAGVNVKSSANIQIYGLEFFGFPRIDGIIRVNSVNGIQIFDNLFHGAFTIASARQSTGIRVDGERVQGVYSQNVKIVGNFIFGIMMSRELYLNPTFRSDGSALGYETDGITFTINRNTNNLIANNSIMDVGEGVDTFSSNAIIRNNYIERAFNYGLKVVHTASSNTFSANRMIATGLAGIVVLGTPYVPAIPATATHPGKAAVPEEASVDNKFIKNKIIYPNAFDISSFKEKIPKHAISAILLDGIVKRNSFIMNEISSPMYVSNVQSLTDWRALVICKWNANESLLEANRSNVLWGNELNDVGNAIVVYEPNANMRDCANENFNEPLLQRSLFNDWTVVNSYLEADKSSVLREYAIPQFGINRLFATSAATPGMNLRRRYPTSVVGNTVTLSAVVRRGSSESVMLRDQVTDAHAVFTLTGAGSVVSTRGAVTDAQVFPLDESWYLVQISYSPISIHALLTLRMINANPGDFVDVGEIRVDIQAAR